jgi:hypothetical protein
MILCGVATVLSDLTGVAKDGEKPKEAEPAKELMAVIKVLSYGIAFSMALVRLVLTLLG